MKYLDPKADLTFKKVFGEHPDLLVSFLNALLPFSGPEEEIRSIEYLPAELFPETPMHKDSIVDVRCKDGLGRVFIVEMQMLWTAGFRQRVLFNASKAYVRQLGKGRDYQLLQPVYSLNLVDAVFEPDMTEYYHDYRLVHMEHSDKVIEGLRLVFVELPKFKPQRFSEKKMHVLWLRYLTEIDNTTLHVSSDLLSEAPIRKAVDMLEVSAFTPAQLEGYDLFWDAVSTRRTIEGDRERERLAALEEGRKEGHSEGMAEGKEQGIKEGMEQGRAEEKLNVARRLKSLGLPVATICEATGLSVENIEGLV